MAWPTFCVATVHICRFCFMYCGLRFYAQSHSDNGHVHATAPCSAHALTQIRPTMSCIPLVSFVLYQIKSCIICRFFYENSTDCLELYCWLRSEANEDNAQHVFYKAVHMFCRNTDMERHRWNAIEELRDHRRHDDRERRIVTRQQELYIRVRCFLQSGGWIPAACSRNWGTQVVNQPLIVYTGIDIAIIFLQRD